MTGGDRVDFLEVLDVLKHELIKGQQVAEDEAGEVLVWTDDTAISTPNLQPETDSETRFQELILAVMGLLQRDRRVTYRTLKHTFSLDNNLLAEIRDELLFKCVAVDDPSKGLVWNGEAQSPVLPVWSDHNQPAMTETTPCPYRRATMRR